jgi:nicotinate-nucleotide adenylyltransferase
VAHLLASLYVLEVSDVDELWWLPTRSHAFGKALAPWEIRLALCALAVGGHPRLRVDPIEGERPGPSYTIDTLAALEERHPGTHFRWLVGSDLLTGLATWHRWEDLRPRLELLVIGRAGARPDPVPGLRAEYLPLELPDISSTLVRSRIQRGEDVRGLLPGAVWRWLQSHPSPW